MCRLSVIFVASSFALSLSANAAQAECRRAAVACESACADPQNDTMVNCPRRCRSIIICDVEPRRSAKNRLPSSTLPSDRLPRSSLPASQLPDSLLN